jgi:chromosome segregation ATPase
MSDSTEVLKSIVSGVLTGGASVVTTVFAVYRDFRGRLKTIEDKIGQDTEPKSGIYLIISNIAEDLRKLKKEILSWEDEAPDWAKKLARTRSSTSDITAHLDFENRVEARLRAFQEKLNRIESDLETAESPNSKLLTRNEYLEDSRERSREFIRLQQELATVGGILRGVMTAMGYLDPEKKDPRTR